MPIIFDFDGPLRSISWRGIFDAYKEIILYKGKNPEHFFSDMGEFRKWYQVDFRKNLEEIGDIEGDDFPAINRIFHGHYDHRVSILSWVPDLLEKISRNHELAVLSSSTSESVKKSLGGLQRFFSAIVGSDDIKNIKPDPEGIHVIIRGLELY